MTCLTPRKTHRSQQAFSLIEGLIALLVLSIGMLAVAALLAKSLQFTHSSYQRSIATVQAIDLRERLWANVCNALPTSDAGICDDNTFCGDWRDTHQDTPGMPSWDGSLDWVSGSADEPKHYAITVSWNDPRLDSAAQSFTYITTIPSLTCP